jgi:hypothetical protein
VPLRRRRRCRAEDAIFGNESEKPAGVHGIDCVEQIFKQPLRIEVS